MECFFICQKCGKRMDDISDGAWDCLDEWWCEECWEIFCFEYGRDMKEAIVRNLGTGVMRQEQ